jgi:protocatechuate 3,4-dioxygenase alpha subunit
MTDRRPPTASQTVGPFFSFALLDLIRPELVPPETPGAIRIEGRVLDGAGAPVDDAMVEIWQADAQGRFARPTRPAGETGFTGFGRCGTDADGRFWFVTTKPGAVPDTNGRQQAPHLAVSVFARGLLKRVVTRIYFPDEEAANAVDPVLSSLASADDRSSLVAVPAGEVLRFDIRLQGERETVFFAV